MYNHFKYLLISLASLMLASCSSDDVEMRNDATAHVSLCVDIPHTSISRGENGLSYSDGKKATNLVYAIYDSSNKLLKTDSTTLSSTLTATISVDLAIGKTYKFAFWAHATNAPYAFDAETGVVTLCQGASDIKCNDDTRDAFYKGVTIEVSETETSHTITLRRPFAQLNFGYTDSSLPFTIGSTEIVVPSATKLNLLTGEKTDKAELTFAANTTPAYQNETFPKELDAMPTYLAMAYLLPCNADEVTYDATLNIYEPDNSTASLTRKYSNLPFKVNHRTNVYGDLASSQNFNIAVDNTYDSTDGDTSTDSSNSGNNSGSEEGDGNSTDDDDEVTEYFLWGPQNNWSHNTDGSNTGTHWGVDLTQYKFKYNKDNDNYTLYLEKLNPGTGFYITSENDIVNHANNVDGWCVLSLSDNKTNCYSDYPESCFDGNRPLLSLNNTLTLFYDKEINNTSISTGMAAASNTTFREVTLTFTLKGKKEFTINGTTQEYSWATLLLTGTEVNE